MNIYIYNDPQKTGCLMTDHIAWHKEVHVGIPIAEVGHGS